MKINKIRQLYLDFFSQKGKDHAIIPSASLIPENDPSVLFTTAGMHPLVPFLMGEKHPAGSRLVNFQKCVRTGDIDEVGDDSHLTFFEMMGNWSLGDYWKRDAINWSYEFLTDKKWLGLDVNKLAVSVFAGDKDSPFDSEAYDLWRGLGISENKIAKLGKDDNWWPAGGQSIGPQGPDTEIFYWTGEDKAPKAFDPDNKRWFEIWNNVFMQYERTEDGKYRPLKQKNVDTGLGLERTAAALQHKKSIYETESLAKLINQIKSIAEKHLYQEQSARIIVDHLRAAIFILADEHGILPSNLGQGYVVRKLVRRAIRHAKEIGIPLKVDVTTPIVEILIDEFKDIYPELSRNKRRVIGELNKEEDSFESTLEKGLQEFEKKRLFYLKIVNDGEKMTEVTKRELEEATISGKFAFNLYSTYGFPLELIEEEAKNRKLIFGLKQKEEFQEEFKKHQDLSRSASAGMFKGGLVSQSEMTIKYHTATHLLHQALREVLGNHVEQRGSNITDERLRFDFFHPQKMSTEEIAEVEKIVNGKINNNLPVNLTEMSVTQAKEQGAIGLFGDKYGEKVKVYSIGPSTSSGLAWSKEICGGPHVKSTGELGHFKIIKEEASSAGIRRIKAVLE